MAETVCFWLLAVTTLAGLDLANGNGVKVLTVLCIAGVGLLFSHS